MIDFKKLPEDLVSILHERFGSTLKDMQIPPPAFIAMQGGIVEYDLNSGFMRTQFPVLKLFQNQFGYMQGGMIVAAIDNTLGPLSMLVAPPNYTRSLDVKFKKAIHPDVELIYVHAKLEFQRKRMLVFSSKVFDKNETVFATAKAAHWILDV